MTCTLLCVMNPSDSIHRAAERGDTVTLLKRLSEGVDPSEQDPQIARVWFFLFIAKEHSEKVDKSEEQIA